MQGNFNDEAATVIPPLNAEGVYAYLFEHESRYVVLNERDVVWHQMPTVSLPATPYDAQQGASVHDRLLTMLGARLAQCEQGSASRQALLVLSIDDFPAVCNSLGRTQGEHLLALMERRLLACLRPGDQMARCEGETFAVVLDAVSGEAQILHTVEYLQHMLAAPLHLGGYELSCSASVGIVPDIEGYQQAASLLRDAMTAMHNARTLSGGQASMFQPAMRARVLERLRLKTELRRAIEQDELCVYYQPIVNLSDSQIVGFEALARWHHPQRGLLTPDSFVPLAEETGLIVPLSLGVLRAACQQMRQWHTSFPHLRHLTVSVNLSVRALAFPGLTEAVAQIVRETGIDVASLKLELTESALIDHSEQTTETLEQLRALGIQLCIDDFGTGYSALQYLGRLPVQTIKIDRSFLVGTDDKASQQAIIQGIVMIGHALGLQLVAEGIETSAQCAVLRDLDCDYGQGYLFSRPIDRTEAEALLAGAARAGAEQRG
jgi:diguanylate cyclase (GGDEF)-like protein